MNSDPQQTAKRKCTFTPNKANYTIGPKWSQLSEFNRYLCITGTCHLSQ